MKPFTKNQIIILVAVIILIFGGIIGWAIFQKLKLLPKEEGISEEEVVPEVEEVEKVFSLTGVVSKVDIKNNFLMVIPTGEENEVKVIISEETKLFKVIYPSESGNPEFATKRVEITIEDIKEGDQVFIKTNVNIAGKKEFDDVDYIEIL